MDMNILYDSTRDLSKEIFVIFDEYIPAVGLWGTNRINGKIAFIAQWPSTKNPKKADPIHFAVKGYNGFLGYARYNIEDAKEVTSKFLAFCREMYAKHDATFCKL